ncbi:hypothetical protein ABID22_000442 [Pontibacter aydingkolensis]|uniref:Uncharacterized protein n=1 Tax=Pontibacter aydingkolensis TaxID=1911536 RepID=A0ABS7CPZ1_9BACT|nr:hypothetical protein [Pontibacter aydingkolensis]MBW7465895.1 hypothetical protein [Pontibacter aydingkolensis]
MRKIQLLGALVIPTLLAVGCTEEQDTVAPLGASNLSEATGNGAPSGAHYTLNIIGVPKGKTAPMDGNNGHRIFVNMEGNTKINLQNADLTDGAFRVLDANGTDSDGALFQLPSADLDNDGITSYSVYARALGKPGGSSTMTTCATDPTLTDDPTTPEDETQVCSLESLVSLREKGGSKFQNVSRDLLYIYADLDGDGTTERVPLFDDRLEDYYWSYDNNGLKVLQLRFYDVPTDVN